MYSILKVFLLIAVLIVLYFLESPVSLSLPSETFLGSRCYTDPTLCSVLRYFVNASWLCGVDSPKSY